MNPEILTVTQLNQAVRTLLEGHFPLLWIEGEISNLSRPGSGHFYFSLKDANAQVRCAMFRRKAGWLSFEPSNGIQVRVRARVSVYPDRGDYQLIIEHMEAAGEGALRRAYDILVQKLAINGLFQEKWKKPIPVLPKHIGVVTSPTGAAIRDILSVLKRRFPSIPVTIYPTKVQGVEAAKEIVLAIQAANSHGLAEVIILARGGGSLEDLWPFNEEVVAYAIYESKIPIISGVGHEIDFTIADLVADKRAPTPSAAAELVTPNQMVYLEQLYTIQNRLNNLIQQQIQYRAQKIDWLSKRLRHPGQNLQIQKSQVLRLQLHLHASIKRYIAQYQIKLENLKARLSTASPTATLERGYAIITESNTGQVIRQAAAIPVNTRLSIQFADGILHCITTQ